MAVIPVIPKGNVIVTGMNVSVSVGTAMELNGITFKIQVALMLALPGVAVKDQPQLAEERNISVIAAPRGRKSVLAQNNIFAAMIAAGILMRRPRPTSVRLRLRQPLRF